MNRDLISALKGNNYQDTNDGDISNQNPEMTQILVDEEFNSQINYLQNELNYAKSEIKKFQQLGTQKRTNVNTSKVFEINKQMDKLNSEIFSRLRNVGNQLVVLGNSTKTIKRDKNFPIRVNAQRKIAKDYKDTYNDFNKVREENQKENYKMFKHQYKITNNNANEDEIQKAFEDNNNEPIFIQKLSNTQLSKRAYQESQDINAEVKRIEQSIEEVFNIFNDMNIMLKTQNDVILTIDEHIDEAEEKVQQASNEMVKAVETRKNSRKLLWIITAIVVILLILFALYIYINFIRPVTSAVSDVVDTVTPNNDNNNN